MVVRPNKPIMFSVIHELGNVSNALPNFRTAIAGKNQLFIEIQPEYVADALQGKFSAILGVKAYQQLVVEAHNSGLKVIPLDEKEKRRRMAMLHTEDMSSYQNLDKREKSWLRILERLNSKSIIVMHPGHAEVICEQLRLPKSNVIWQDTLSAFRRYELELMKNEQEKSRQTRSKIERIRIQRKIGESMRRQQIKPPKKRI
ncbi:MAG: hypothetical protein ABIH20_00440 [Candidatus Diapherotrites archaeon]